MARRKTAHTVAIEGVKDKDDDGQIDESKNKRGVNREQGSTPDGSGGVHLKDQRFSRCSVRKSSVSVISRMQTEMAAPSGQSKAAPNRLWTTLAIMVPEGPPTRSGARKSPRERTKAKVAPASRPGSERGRMTRRNVCAAPAPRSCEASTSGRGMCSRAAYMGRKTKGV